ncbi:hypothetical protein [Ruegeria sp. Ofav3-42]|uniref:tetratricopeptide repeat protein n=1 Tax=Ruegeria sp. Ofav3-42 TaxID=2917759 RepID=UPI001EF53607|nr:hypothetical protein [Ruegeria sp. Ofav3-42]MCG7521532.1 hypothetical protein [Ruegeria sp. Ofav3-42]
METGIQEADKVKALQSVCDSELFSHLDRLCAFLTYVVTEELAGRGDLIMGKTIAQDVYGRDPSEAGDTDNVVRVDARRLRQNLDHYYDTAGSADPVRIFVDTGGYRPRFERAEAPQRKSQGSSKRTIGFAALAFVIGTAIGVAVGFGPLTSLTKDRAQDLSSTPSHDSLKRQALREQSATSLQAVNLAEQARSMIFPIFDRPRQKLVTEIFRHAIELGPDYFGGYAGAAQTLATLAIMTPPGPEKNALVGEAQAMAENALRLAPTDPWAQSAQAWVKFSNREYDEAVRISNRAVTFAPDDENVLDVHGSIALFSGNFAEAASVAEKAMNTGGSNKRLANRNIYGAANFHLGNYKVSLESLLAAADSGDPISAPSFVYQTAALFELGRIEDAARKHAELKKSWPDVDVERMLTGIFRSPAHVEKVMKSIRMLEQETN